MKKIILIKLNKFNKIFIFLIKKIKAIFLIKKKFKYFKIKFYKIKEIFQ